jgi:hypothetical protein
MMHAASRPRRFIDFMDAADSPDKTVRGKLDRRTPQSKLDFSAH